MAEWIKFHRQLCSGEKRGIPRALRFVYLELCLAALELHGTVRLPLGMTLLDAVHDRIGGDRKEIKRALEIFTSGPEPSLILSETSEKRELSVRNWEQWNTRDWSSDRVRQHRERKKNDVLETDVTVSSVTDPAVTVTAGNALDQIRSDQKREEERRERKEETTSPPKENVADDAGASPSTDGRTTQPTRREGRRDLDPSTLTDLERAAHAAIVADESLLPIVGTPVKLARDLVRVGPGVNVPMQIAKAGAWLRANPCKAKKNGARFLLGWVEREQERCGGQRSLPISGPVRGGFVDARAAGRQAAFDEIGRIIGEEEAKRHAAR